MITAYFSHLRFMIPKWRKVEPPDPVPDDFLDKDANDNSTIEAKTCKDKIKDKPDTLVRKNSILSIWV